MKLHAALDNAKFEITDNDGIPLAQVHYKELTVHVDLSKLPEELQATIEDAIARTQAQTVN